MIVYDKNIFGSNREIDSNGYLRVDSCNITKTQVAPYLGREIPGWQEMGLEAEKIYYVLRPEDELKKAVPTFNNLPLTREHIEVDVENVPKEKIVGSLGDHTEFVDGYLRNNLIIYDKKDIDLVMSGKKKELSCGYRYTPVREAGSYKGQHYDFVMKDIIGNHVALVKEGRAGHDVVVSDTINKVKEKFMSWFRKNEVVCDEKGKEDDVEWITVRGNHIPVGKGQSKEEAVKSFVESKKESSNSHNDELDSLLKTANRKFEVNMKEGNFEAAEKQLKAAKSIAEKIGGEMPEQAERLENFAKRLKEAKESSKENKDVENYWQGEGSKESQKSGKIQVMKKQLEDLRGMLKEAISNSSEEGKERIAYLKKDIENLEKEIGKQMAGGKSEKDLIKEFQETSNEIGKMLENEERLAREAKFSEEGKRVYEEHSGKLKELNAKKNDLDKQIKALSNDEEMVEDKKLSDAEQEKVGVVMKEFKDGELKSGSGEKVTNPKQAIAIALSEADKMAKDKDIPDEQEKPEKAGEGEALVKGEEEMTEEVKEALAEKEVKEVKEAEDACGKAKDEKDDKLAEDKEVDKRKLIDEIGGILKSKKVDDEVIRTVMKKCEEMAYNKSESGEADDEKLESKKDFAEGVKYGEEKEKEEPKKLDSEHESEGAKKADEKKVEEKKEAEDEDKEEKKEDKMAKDSALAMDIDAIKQAVRDEMKADFKAREDARKAVRSIVGDVNVMTFDSAEDIYKFACEQAGMDLNEIVSYKDAFKGLTAGKSKLALDASPVSGSNEECFADIRIA